MDKAAYDTLCTTMLVHMCMESGTNIRVYVLFHVPKVCKVTDPYYIELALAKNEHTLSLIIHYETYWKKPFQHVTKITNRN